MARHDAIVVGGGPAGSSCARDLVRAGLDVLVVDAARFPRDKCCAGWITPDVISALALDLEDYAEGRTLQVITGFSTRVLGRRPVRTEFGEPVSHAIRRCEFDHYLLRRSGAPTVLGRPVRHIVRKDDQWVIDDELTAPILVGAGGHFCPVARLLNPGRNGAAVIVAQEVEVRLSPDEAIRCPVRADRPELYFCLDRRGYGWCVRKDDYLNVGFGRLRDDRFQDEVRAFADFLVGSGTVPAGFPRRWPGHAYRLLARPRRRVVADGILLAGDAAGLAHPVSGEGILMAVESGRLAARAILSADGAYTRDRLRGYQAAIDRRCGRPGRAGGNRWGLPQAFVTWLGGRLMARPWFVRRVLLERWFLHRGRAPLDE